MVFATGHRTGTLWTIIFLPDFQPSWKAGRVRFLVSSHFTLYRLIPMALFSRDFPQREFCCCSGVNPRFHRLHSAFSGPSLCSPSSLLPPPTYVPIPNILTPSDISVGSCHSTISLGIVMYSQFIQTRSHQKDSQPQPPLQLLVALIPPW